MPKNESLQSARRAIRVLYAIAGSEEGKTINQIAAILGIKPNTAYRLIKTLEQEHVLRRLSNPLRFALGPALSELKRLDDTRHLLTVSESALIRAHTRIPQANLALLELHGTETFQRLCVESSRPGVCIRRREYKLEFYSRATTLLFLTFVSPDEARRIHRAHPFESEGKPVWKSHARLEAFLREIRKTGIARLELPGQNFFRVAAPVFSSGKEVIAAIGGYMPPEESLRAKTQLARVCRDAAKEIMKRMA